MIHSSPLENDHDQHWKPGTNVLSGIPNQMSSFIQAQNVWGSTDTRSDLINASNIQGILGKNGYEDSAGQSENDSAEDVTNSGKQTGATSDTIQDLSFDQQSRRKEQNRAAQRAFRERKERYVKELETKIKQLNEEHENNTAALKKENSELHALVKRMESEIYTLKGAAMAFDMSMKKLREAGIDVPSVHRELSPPTSDCPNAPCSDGNASPCILGQTNSNDPMMDISDISMQSTVSPSYPQLFPDPMHGASNLLNEAPKLFEDIHHESVDAMAEDDHFAESQTARFDHTPHPVTLTDAKLIPCAQVWERLAEHPRFEDFDVDALCAEVKKKAICSGTGPVITESEFREVLKLLGPEP